MVGKLQRDTLEKMKERREFIDTYDKIFNETSGFIDNSIKQTQKLFKKLNDRKKELFHFEDVLFRM